MFTEKKVDNSNFELTGEGGLHHNGEKKSDKTLIRQNHSSQQRIQKFQKGGGCIFFSTSEVHRT